MRIGSIAPRINGVNLGAVGALGTFDLASNVEFDLNSFMVNLQPNMEHGTAATPDTVRQSLLSRVQDVCAANYPSSCDPSSVYGLIDQAVQKYSAAYSLAQANTYAMVQSREIVTPTGYVAPVPPIYAAPPPTLTPTWLNNQPTNALDRITPAYTPVIKAPETNALNPPQSSTPVAGQNAGTFTGTDTTTQRPGDEAPPYTFDPVEYFFTGSGFGVPNWLVTGGVVVGLYLLLGKKGR